jgi:hypothetical protein
MLRDSTRHSMLNFACIKQELSEKIESEQMRAPTKEGGIVRTKVRKARKLD